MGCLTNDDCLGGRICVNQACEFDDGMRLRLDGGATVHPDARPLSDATAAADAGTPREDASVGRDSAAGPDGAAGRDGSSSSDDAGGAPVDAGGGGRDAMPPADVGPVASGIYDYRRILTAQIPSNAYLTRLAVAPDDQVVVVAEAYDRLHVLDITSSTATVSVPLPKDSSEALLVESVVYSRDGSALLIAATRVDGRNRQGRFYRAGHRGERLAEVERTASVSLRAIAVDPLTAEIAVLGSRAIGGGYAVYVYRYDRAQHSLQTPAVQGGLSAGCQDAVWVDDGLGGRGLLYVCGEGGAAAGVLDSTGAFVDGPSSGQIGNLPRVAGRPSGDYALGIHRERVYRFEAGVWSVGFSAPAWGQVANWDASFSDDGARALAVGDFGNGVGEAREYRHDLYSTQAISDVSIPGFGVMPYLGIGGVHFDDVAWRPGSDCGFIAGGCSTGSCRRGYLIAFRVLNGRGCP